MSTPKWLLAKRYFFMLEWSLTCWMNGSSRWKVILLKPAITLEKHCMVYYAMFEQVTGLCRKKYRNTHEIICFGNILNIGKLLKTYHSLKMDGINFFKAKFTTLEKNGFLVKSRNIWNWKSASKLETSV